MNLLGQWIGLIVGVIAIVGQAVQWTWGYAELAGRTQRNTDEIARNFKEDEYNRDRMFKSIERIDATMSGMTQVYVKIGQMETQLANITEILKDLRTQVLERRPTKQ